MGNDGGEDGSALVRGGTCDPPPGFEGSILARSRYCKGVKRSGDREGRT